MTSLATIRQAWDDAARQDAQGHILTIPGLTTEEFYERGRTEIQAVIASLEEHGLATHRRHAIDFGCGIGRLTLPLAEHYDHVTAIDIAPSMIDQATEHDRITYHCTSTLDHLPDQSADLIYSNITLQHMPTTLQEAYVRDFVRLAHPEGAIVFEIPECPSATGEYQPLHMYGTPRDTVTSWIQDAGATIHSITETPSAGGVPSYRYTCRQGRVQPSPEQSQ